VTLRNDIRRLVARAEAAGARVEDRGGRWLVYRPDGRTIVTVHKTPSDRRVIRIVTSELRGGGLDL
jgi:hypothetical protein